MPNEQAAPPVTPPALHAVAAAGLTYDLLTRCS